MEILRDTTDCASDDRVDAWQQILTEFLVPFHVEPAPESPFRGQLRCNHLGPVDVVATTRTPCVNRRPQGLIGHTGDTRLALALLVAGDWIVIENRSQQRLQPGDLVLWDLVQPMTLASSTTISALSFRMPMQVLDLGIERLLTSAANVLPTNSGLGAMITTHLHRLAGLDDDQRPDIATRLGATTADLLATYFAFLRGETSPIDGADRRTLLHQVKTHIEGRLGEPELGPATITAAHHVCVRSLYKLFAADGHTVAGWIRQRRLERTRRDLADPAWASSSITEVAYRWGFTDSAHFSRAFKTSYGTSPRDYRRSTTPSAADNLPPKGALLDNNRAGTVKTPSYRSAELETRSGQ